MAIYHVNAVRRYSRVLAIAGVVIAGLAPARVARAHVTVSPAVVPTSTYQSFTLEVPTEKLVPTVSVRVEFPPELSVARFQPKPGWERTVEKDPAGRILAAEWSGGSIGSDEYEQFVFLARTPAEPGELIFKAYQTYEGDEVVAWTGGEEDDFPAAVVTVTGAPADATGASAPSIEEPAATEAATRVEETATTAAVATLSPDSTPESTQPAPAATAPPAATLPTAPIALTPPAATGPEPAEVSREGVGGDLGLFVALGSLVTALVSLAVAGVGLGLARRRGATPE